jgi:heparanase 1
MGPDCWEADVSAPYWISMLGAVSPRGALHAITVHDYGGDCVGDVSAEGLALNLTCLDAQARGAAAVVALATPFGVPVWNGESALEGDSGADGLTNTFVSSLWYANEMGLYAASGVGLVSRQTLVGGDYELVNKTTFRPNPDYYLLLAWRAVMGAGVLNATSSDPTAPVRAYSHCAKGSDGGVSTVLINFSLNASFAVSLGWPAPPAAGSTVDVYQLSPIAGYSGSATGAGAATGGVPKDWFRVALNGVELDYRSGSGRVPAMPPQSSLAAAAVTLPPSTVTFVVRKDAGAVGACTAAEA